MGRNDALPSGPRFPQRGSYQLALAATRPAPQPKISLDLADRRCKLTALHDDA